MNTNDESNKKMVECLWVEINRAILSSPDVKAILANLRELGLLEEIKLYNLVVDVNKMVEMILDRTGNVDDLLALHKATDIPKERLEPNKSLCDENPFFSETNAEPKPEKRETGTVPHVRQYIDGRPLSNNQINFQEYQAQKFDMAAWMKKARIRF